MAQTARQEKLNRLIVSLKATRSDHKNVPYLLKKIEKLAKIITKENT